MRSYPGNTAVALLLIAGLAFGSAAHRVQHGVDYARSVLAVHVASPAHTGEITVGAPARSAVVDEAICVLCQVVDAQVLLAPVAWQLLDPGRPTAPGTASVVPTASIARITGRSPPGRL